jgi:hypothetical protein
MPLRIFRNRDRSAANLFEVAARILLIALLVTIAAVRVKRADLAGAQTTRPAQPGTKRAPEMLGAGSPDSRSGPGSSRQARGFE